MEPTISNLSITLWQGDIAAKDNEHKDYWRILDPNEKDYAHNIKNNSFKKHYVEVRARLRIVLGNCIGSSPTAVSVLKTEFGKPYLPDFPQLQFNLSHTENKLVVAIANNCRYLGVDIESCKPRANLPALVNRCFAEVEKSYWHQLPNHQQTDAFYRFWTLKEAFVKATGRGIALGLNQCIFDPESPSRLLAIPNEFGSPDDWLMESFGLEPSICGAVAAHFYDKNNLERLSIEKADLPRL